jgi:hypothetical protein
LNDRGDDAGELAKGDMMNLFNALSQAFVGLLAIPAARTSTYTGTGIDVTAYEGMAAIILNSAAGTGTTPTLDVKLQDCATVGGTYADVAGATFAQVTDAADALELITVNISDLKQFIRVVGTIAGTTPSFTFGVEFVGVKKAN